MADADSILQGFLIGSFSFCGVLSVVYCLKKKHKSYSMKKSQSMEELSSVETTDPTQTQDEGQYALPPVLVTIASPRMGSFSAGR